MPVREELIEIQKRLVKRLKTELYNDYCVKNPEIDKYYDDYKRLTGNYNRVATKQELIEAILNSDIVYLGDYHTLRQSQETLIRILEALPKDSRQIILGLEMVQSKSQDILDQYINPPEADLPMAQVACGDSEATLLTRPWRGSKKKTASDNQIPEKSFLESINYENTWGFNWNNYKIIIDYAREHQIKVIALNSEPSFYVQGLDKGEKVTSLYRRDAVAAKIITKTLLNNPKSIFIVLFGDLHISENHLPLQVDDSILKKNLSLLRSATEGLRRSKAAAADALPKRLIICQNSERIYWQLAKTGEEQTIDVVQIKDNVYCVMNSTPLTVFQSCTQWYNREKELQTCLIHKNWCDKDTSTSFLEEVVQLIKVICGFLDLEVPALDDLTVCTSHDFELLRHIKKDTLSPEEVKRLEIDLLKTESYFIEKQNMVCLTNFSLNHAAEQSAHFIHHYYSRDTKIPPRPYGTATPPDTVCRDPVVAPWITHREKMSRQGRRTPPDNFYYTVLREALGFFGSKIINHKRMCYKEPDYEDFLTQHKHRKITLPKLKELKEISIFVKEHKKRERDYLNNNVWKTYKKISYLSLEEFIGISHALGYILGDKLYESILQGVINRSEIRELFLDPFDARNKPLNKYLYLIRRVQSVKETYLRKTDHL